MATKAKYAKGNMNGYTMESSPYTLRAMEQAELEANILVEGELAVGVYGGLQATIDPFLYTLLLTIHPERTAEEAIRAVEDEIKRIQDTPPSPEELARAVKQARALIAYGSESISNQAFWLGYAEMFSTYNWFLEYLERLEAVSPADVRHAAQVYLRPQNRIIGVYLPGWRDR